MSRLHSYEDYLDLLKDETSEIDLVSPTFTSLKAILSISPLNDSDSRNRYQRAIHALLSSCLLNIDEMRYVRAIFTLERVVQLGTEGGSAIYLRGKSRQICLLWS